MSGGLEMLRGQRVVLFQVFATKLEVIVTPLFWGIVAHFETLQSPFVCETSCMRQGKV